MRLLNTDTISDTDLHSLLPLLVHQLSGNACAADVHVVEQTETEDDHEDVPFYKLPASGGCCY